ncbi:hypothetical protein VTN96DRAFT_4539 [Rasamsonia emersonii]
MYSCANYPRGCRGRVNVPGAKCSDCLSLNLRRPSSLSSPFAQNREYRRPIRTDRQSQGEDKTNEV